jgi:lysophospholipase L1-like esterase
LDRKGLEEYGPINIVIFGDSVSHGAVSGYMDYENVYWNLLKKKLNKYRDYMPVNMINVSVGGTVAASAVNRLESQALNHSPDLVIVCFGLNDVNGALETYLTALKTIFEKCLAANCEVIFMTPNMLNTYVTDDTKENLRHYASVTAGFQNNGKMDEFMYSAIDLAKSMGVGVCDCYSKWKELSKTTDITMLLANRINHPISEMHNLFAESLYEVIMGEEAAPTQSDSTMFNGK